eukprot:g32.t1
MRQDARPTNPTKPWKCNVEAEPVEVRARVLDPLQVVFQEKKVYPVEDGNFTKLLRNGLQCAVKLDDWSLMYPSSDESVLDIWLRSLKDIELPEKIANHVNERTQLVLLLIPVKDSPKAYNLFKQLMLTQLPCVTQVVRSETIRKRQSIAAVLSRLAWTTAGAVDGSTRGWPCEYCLRSEGEGLGKFVDFMGFEGTVDFCAAGLRMHFDSVFCDKHAAGFRVAFFPPEVPGFFMTSLSASCSSTGIGFCGVGLLFFTGSISELLAGRFSPTAWSKVCTVAAAAATRSA